MHKGDDLMDIRETHKNVGPEERTTVDEMYGFGGGPMMPPPPPPDRYYGGGYHRGGCGCGTCLGFFLLPLIIIGLLAAIF